MQALRSAHRLRAAFAGALVVAVLVMQSLGLLHRVVHEVSGYPVVSGLVQLDDSKRTLFNHDAENCALYDQLTHADMLWSAPKPVVLDQRPMDVPQVHRAWHLAHQAAGFLARGPPSLS